MKVSLKNLIVFSVLIALLILSLIFDSKLIEVVESLKNPFLDSFFYFVMFFEKGIIFYPLITLVALSLIIWKKKSVFPYLLSIFIAVILGLILKSFISRPRPLLQSFDSFPSGHANFLAASLPFIEKKTFKWINALFIIIASVMLFARVWFGLHYFSDIFGGIILGCGISLIIKNILKNKV